MASANVDFVRSIFAAWERGDFSSADWADPEIEFVIVGGNSAGSWRGLAGMSKGFRDWLSAWDGFRVKADEYRELDDERVLVLLYASGRGKISGLQVGQIGTKGANVFHIRGRKVTRLVLDWDREHALADVGLAPEADSPAS